MTHKQMSRLQGIALLSISFILTTAYAISPGIPLMLESFPEQTETSIQILTTIPAFSVMVMVLFSSWISDRLGIKNTVGLGLLLVSIFGPLPAMLNNFTMILISRVILGIGFGLINPLAVSLISHFYRGDQAATMMGYRSASESIGQASLIAIAGYILEYASWRASFLVYLIAIPILILFWLAIPDVSMTDETVTDQSSERPKQSVNGYVIYFALLLFFVVGSYVGVKVRLSQIVLHYGYGTIAHAGNILSALTFVGVAAGVFFGRLHEKLGRYLLPLAMTLVGLGYLGVAYSTSLLLTTIASLTVGFCYPAIIAYVFTLANQISEPNSNVLTSSFMLLGCNVGAFLSPYGFRVVSALTGSQSLVLPFYIYGAILIGLAVVTLMLLNRVVKD